MNKIFYTNTEMTKILQLKDNRRTRRFLARLGLNATLVGERKYIYFLSDIQNKIPQLYFSLMEIEFNTPDILPPIANKNFLR